jgi:hypothetical protein
VSDVARSLGLRAHISADCHPSVLIVATSGPAFTEQARGDAAAPVQDGATGMDRRGTVLRDFIREEAPSARGGMSSLPVDSGPALPLVRPPGRSFGISARAAAERDAPSAQEYAPNMLIFAASRL